MKSPFLALGAAASVPLVVAASEHYGGKQLGGLAALVYANAQWAQQALPTANACLERLADLLTEASETLARHAEQSHRDPPASPGNTSTIGHPSAAAVLASQQASLKAPGVLGSTFLSPTSQNSVQAPDASTTPTDKQLGALPAAKAAVSSVHPGRKAMRIQSSHPVPAARLAQEHGDAVAHVRGLLASQHGLSVLPARFTDAELMRCAVTKGYLRAQSSEDQRCALEQAASMAAHTAQWLEIHPFASCQELQSYAHLLYWDGTDGAGHPVLHICIGRAVVECRGAEALAFSNAIITQLQYAVDHMLSDSGDGRPDRIVVVMDCSRSSTLAAASIAGVFRAVSASLNQHYPGRLHSLVLLDLPPMLTWLVAAVKKLVHPDTRDKVKVVKSGEVVSVRQASASTPEQRKSSVPLPTLEVQ